MHDWVYTQLRSITTREMTCAVNKGLRNPILPTAAGIHSLLALSNQHCLLLDPPRASKRNVGLLSKSCSGWFLPCNIFILCVWVCSNECIYIYVCVHMCLKIRGQSIPSSLTWHLILSDSFLLNLDLTNLLRFVVAFHWYFNE